MKNLFEAIGRFYTKEGSGTFDPVPEKGWDLYWMIVKNYHRDLIILNSITILLTLPVITAPAAIFALVRVEMKLSMDKVCLTKEEYWTEFKKSVLKSIPVMAIPTGLAGLLVILSYEGLAAYDDQKMLGYLITAASIILLFVLHVVVAYLLCFEVSVDLTTAQNLKNSLTMTVTNIKKNVLFLIPLAIELLMMLLLPYSLVLIVLLIPAFTELARCVVIKQEVEKIIQ